MGKDPNGVRPCGSCPWITELKNQPSVEVKDKGPGLGIALVDHGPDHEIVMIVLLKTGEITAEKLPARVGTGVYVTKQQTG